MITLLSQLFIKDVDPSSPGYRRRMGLLCGLTGVALNLALFAGKLFAGLASGSIAITADAVNNLSDAGSSVVTLLGFKLAAASPDKEHPFGHGRFEYISGFVVSIIIIVMALELGQVSVGKIISPQPVEYSVPAMLILVISVVVKGYMAYYNRAIGRKISSAAMEATALDSISDAVSTSAVLLSLLVGRFFAVNMDGWFGLLVAAFILYTGISAVKNTISPLLGRPPSPKLVNEITELVQAYPDVVGVHDLIVHDYGPGRMMISLHAEVPSSGNMLALHDTIDTIERRLKAEFGCHAVIHMDPLEVDDEATSRMHSAVLKIVKEISGAISIHDFRMVTGPTHVNLIFDAVVPFGFHLTDKQVKAAIEGGISGFDGQYFAVVTIDKAMS